MTIIYHLYVTLNVCHWQQILLPPCYPPDCAADWSMKERDEIQIVVSGMPKPGGWGAVAPVLICRCVMLKAYVSNRTI